MSREALAAWYLQNVGYDPTVDEPSITDDVLREQCIEMDDYDRCTVDGKGRTQDHSGFDPTVTGPKWRADR